MKRTTAPGSGTGTETGAGRGGGPSRRRLLGAGAAAVSGAFLTGVAATRASGEGAGTGTVAGSGAAAKAAPKAPAAPRAADWAALGKGLDGTLVRPGDRDYDAARTLFNPRCDGVRPAGVAYCARPEDVRECLEFARAHGVPVAVRSGGHSYAGWSSGPGLIVDVQRMAAVSLSGGTATIGAGAKLIDVYDRLTARGRTVPAGSCPTVGVAGLALGGGIGVVSRAYGLTSDSVTGARIVTADGRIRDVDAKRDPDLFWALRGGGNAQFGVVTELRMRTHAAPECTTFFLRWPWARAAAVVREWQRWAPTAPDGIWANLHLAAPVGGRPGSVRVGGLALTDRRDLENRLDRLAGAIGAAPTSEAIRTRPFMDAMKVMGGVSGRSVAEAHQKGTLPGRRPQGRVARESYAARSDFYTRAIPAAGVKALISRVEALARLTGGGAGSIALDAMGGAVNRVRAADTAFVHRDALFLAQYIVSWPDRAPAATVARHQAWLDGTHGVMRPWASGRAYQNYTDPALRDWRRAYYGANIDRLVKVKAAYDPGRLFRHGQSF
ncbi:FAD-binding oxidoreductase [Streptomyces sp. WAC05374]|uniref:FAD-binding oxidoreductase n=1 Tax=Streptomyces sp. WAC05374 TaxID=2487420 RepID=UPI000F87F266|nr:FAD-binding oxidoreductase [Streptomyces sp. WAC05374]RST09342.1 FAD-binding oxidoreductase [Streptomyces sp. WAC05374]TDF52628.1 FAD-binding oxidoreductase [Streptomyces sp. WAC05374]TDF54047.1 FAD-binding oxidoreductase [Streptomyces sp. WAC05374]